MFDHEALRQVQNSFVPDKHRLRGQNAIIAPVCYVIAQCHYRLSEAIAVSLYDITLHIT